MEGELKGITRRGFLKIAAATAVLASLPKALVSWAESQEQKLIPPTPLPGDLQVLNDVRIKQTASINSETTRLPEKEITNWQWIKENPQNSPPGAYRSAMAWDERNQRFLLHGGYTGNGNHNETWSYQNGVWTKLEAGSTPGLHGHKMVDTPEGVILYGGLIQTAPGQYVDSQDFYIFRENRWQKLTPANLSGHPIPGLQGMGMVYNPETKSVWIMGGASGRDVFLSDVTFELMLPGVWTPTSDWTFRGRGYIGSNFYSIFEPLAFVKPSDEKVYLYGGMGYDRGQGIGVYSNDIFTIRSVNTNIEITQANWPGVDYGGVMRGGFNHGSSQLFLHNGHAIYFFGPQYQESVVFDSKNNSWVKAKSGQNPPVSEKPAVVMNPKTGVSLRFGGAIWNGTNWNFSNETWKCNYIHKVYMPYVSK